MKLVSMEMSAKERKQASAPTPAGKDAPIYPYGLKLHLDNDALKKLKIDQLPQVGKTLQLIATVEVCEVSEVDTGNGSQRKSISLQITELGLTAPSGLKDSDVFYDAKGQLKG